MRFYKRIITSLKSDYILNLYRGLFEVRINYYSLELDVIRTVCFSSYKEKEGTSISIQQFKMDVSIEVTTH